MKLFRLLILLQRGILVNFRYNLHPLFLVKSNDKKVKNFVKSEQKWQKNIYLNCHLHDGGTRASEEALKVLLQQSHENIYESVYNVTRYKPFNVKKQKGVFKN